MIIVQPNIIFFLLKSLPPVHCAMIKKRAFSFEILPTAIIEMVTAGLSCPPEMCRTDMAKVAMLNPWLKAMCITEGGL